jgi:hypothetical protein
VDIATAREHVIFALSRTFRGDVAYPENATFSVADVTDHPHEVYDVNGSLLFYLFPVQLPGAPRQSWARAAADKRVGPAIVSVETPRVPLDPDALLERARVLFPTLSGPPRLVTYSYPRLGVVVPQGATDVIYDAVSFERVPVRRPGSASLGAWSFFGEVVEPEVERRIRLWERDQAEIVATLRALGIPGLTAAQNGQPDPGAPGVVSRLLRYSPHCLSHPCFALYGQEDEFFCTVAVAQMILDFYRYNHLQAGIAPVIHAGNCLPLPVETDEKRAYETLSNGCLVATIDMWPTWIKARAEIDDNRPFRDGIDDHVRACAGWLQETNLSTGQVLRQWLRIYDPQPDNPDMCVGGQVLWEEWDAIPHKSFINVRHRSTPCPQAAG